MMNTRYSIQKLAGIMAFLVFTSVTMPVSALPFSSRAQASDEASHPSDFASAARTEQPAKKRFGERLLIKVLERKWQKKLHKQMHLPGEMSITGQPPEKGKHWNLISMILGLGSIPLVILALVTLGSLAEFLLLLGIGAAVIGLIMGIKGLKRNYPQRGQGMVGLVASCVTLGGLAIGVVALVVYLFWLLLSYP